MRNFHHVTAPDSAYVVDLGPDACDSYFVSSSFFKDLSLEEKVSGDNCGAFVSAKAQSRAAYSQHTRVKCILHLLAGMESNGCNLTPSEDAVVESFKSWFHVLDSKMSDMFGSYELNFGVFFYCNMNTGISVTFVPGMHIAFENTSVNLPIL